MITVCDSIVCTTSNSLSCIACPSLALIPGTLMHYPLVRIPLLPRFVSALGRSAPG